MILVNKVAAMMTWPERAYAAGLSQRVIAALLDQTDDGVSRSIRRDPPSGAVRAVIAAWEIMSPEQRLAWLAERDVPTDRRRRGRPRKPDLARPG